MFTKSDLLNALQKHIGISNGARSDALIAEIIGKPVVSRTLLRHLRHQVTDLRNEGHMICAHPSTGYFIAANEAELNMTCTFLYERAMSSLKQISRMKKIAVPDLRGQLRLPT